LTSLDEIDAVFKARHDIVEADFQYEIILNEMSLTYLLDFVKEVKSILDDETKKSGQPLDKTMTINHILLVRGGLHQLYSALFLTRRGHFDNAYSAIRTVMETIWKLYMIDVCEEEDANLLIKSELGTLTAAEETIVRNQWKYFSAAKLHGFLYEDRKFKQFRKMYGAISKNSHPSIEGCMSEFELKKTVVEDLLMSIPLIVSGLIFLGLEVYYNKLSTSQREYYEGKAKTIASMIYNLPNFSPDKSSVVGKLKYHQPTA